MAKGRLTYTLASVAFPRNPTFGSEIDNLDVGLDAKGGGTHGEFQFTWHSWDQWKDQPPSLRFHCFTDGLLAFMDERVQNVVRELARRQRERRDVTPARLIEMLEAEGARPSHYHLRGLLESEQPRKYDEEMRLRQAYEEAKKYEEAN